MGPKLVPFFKTVALFFILFDGDYIESSILYSIFKCLPIVSLIVFVLLHGMDFSDAYDYSRRIMIGLMLSCVGDICMVYKAHGYFIPGVAFFAGAQAMYSLAFGFKPLKLYVGGIVCAIGSIVFSLLLPGFMGVMKLVGFIYTVLIMTMLWRAIARVRLYNNMWTWTSMCSCLGAIAFVISDTLIAFNRFRFSIGGAEVLIMVTYYAGQLGIALSVVDSQVDTLLEKTKPKETKVQ